MTLKPGYSNATLRANIAKLLASGHSRNYSSNTAKCAARVSFFRRFPCGAIPLFLAHSRSERLAICYGKDGEALQKNPRRTGRREASPRQGELRKAAKLIQDFSGHKARILGKVAAPKIPRTAIAIGNVLGISYETKRDGVLEKYYHRFTLKTARPLLIASPDGKQLFLIGGSYNFTERGIVDRK